MHKRHLDVTVWDEKDRRWRPLSLIVYSTAILGNAKLITVRCRAENHARATGFPEFVEVRIGLNGAINVETIRQ